MVRTGCPLCECLDTILFNKKVREKMLTLLPFHTNDQQILDDAWDRSVNAVIADEIRIDPEDAYWDDEGDGVEDDYEDVEEDDDYFDGDDDDYLDEDEDDGYEDEDDEDDGLDFDDQDY